MSRHRSSRSPALRIRRDPLARAVLAAFAGTLAGAPLSAPPVLAQEGSGPESALRRFDIPSGDLGRALSAAAVRGGVQLSFDPELTRGKTTPGLSGEFTAREALAKLLAGSGLELVPGPGSTYGLQSVPVTAAEPAKPEKPVQLEPMEVIGQPLDQDQGFKSNYQTTATKSPLSIRETPQSISVITQDALEARQVIDFGQALQTAAGVNQFAGAGPFAGRNLNQGATQIRGFSTDFDTERDEGFISPIFNVRPDLAPYERIEVVKGPSSVLYGRGTAGGFTNRVRKKPLGVFASEFDASVGSFDFYRAEGDVTGPLFESERARGRLVLAYENAGAFVDGVESELVVAAPSLAFDITGSTRLLLLGSYQREEFLPNPGIPLVRDGDTLRLPNIRRSLYTGVRMRTKRTAKLGSVSHNWSRTSAISGWQRSASIAPPYGSAEPPKIMPLPSTASCLRTGMSVSIPNSSVRTRIPGQANCGSTAASRCWADRRTSPSALTTPGSNPATGMDLPRFSTPVIRMTGPISTSRISPTFLPSGRTFPTINCWCAKKPACTGRSNSARASA